MTDSLGTRRSFQDRTGMFMTNCSGLGFVIRARITEPGGHLVSNDLVDLAETQCQLCGLVVGMQAVHDHVRKVHQLLFRLYRKEFGCPAVMEPILHRCGLCGDRIMFHRSSIAAHLRIKHKEMVVVQPTVDILVLDKEVIDHLLPWPVVKE